MNTKESQSPLLGSFSSLTCDLVLNCLARVPRIYHPTLSLVSKTFRSLLSSHELEATITRIGMTEDCHYVCLNLNKNNPDPLWFALSPIPNQQKLIPIPPLPFHKHPIAPTVLPVGSEIYVIGGFLDSKRSKRVFVLDCRSYQWRRLPDMHVARRHPAADAEVIEGKVCVIGGNYSSFWGEVYDPKTQTWEPLEKTALDLTIQKSVRPGNLVMGGKNYSECGEKCYTGPKHCYVMLENVWCMIHIKNGKLCNSESEVLGLEGLSSIQFFSVANSIDGRVTVWSKMVEGLHNKRKCKTKIWCAEILLERRSSQEVWGFVEWSSNVLTLDGCDANSHFFLHSAIVTY